MTVQLAAFIGGLVGCASAYALFRKHLANVKADRCRDAFEDGWSQGYEVGLRAERPKRTRKRKDEL